MKCRQVRSLPHPLRGSPLAEGAFPQLQNFLNHLAKSFRVGYNRNIRKPIPCPACGLYYKKYIKEGISPYVYCQREI